MASFRRTPSPAYQAAGNSHSQKLLPSSAKPSSTFPSFLTGIFLQGHSRKSHQGYRRSFYRCSIFFLLGFLVGITPFGYVDDVRNHDFSFEIMPPQINSQLDGISIDPVSLRVTQAENQDDRFHFTPTKQLIVVTPTYSRALQAYFLNRLGHVLRLVPPPVLWIVVEMKSASMETAEILMKSGVMYRHLVSVKNSTNVKDRGVHQRNAALDHIEKHRLDGIVYFADDDNVYSLHLFQSLREISRFGTWPVAMLMQSKNKAILEGPVCNGSQVIGWHTNEKSKRLRRFHVDMSGFAFNSTILWDPRRWKRPISNPIRQLDIVKEGFQETTFIEQLVEDESQMEGAPPGCSRIMNWHLHLEARNFLYPRGWLLHKNLDVVLPVK